MGKGNSTMPGLKEQQITVKWFGVQLPIARGIPALASLCVEKGAKQKILQVEARNPLEAYYGLRWELQKEFGISQAYADKLLGYANILPQDGPESPEQSNDEPPF